MSIIHKTTAENRCQYISSSIPFIMRHFIPWPGVLLFLLVLLLAECSAADHDHGDATTSPPPRGRRIVLALGAANSYVNWTRVEEAQQTSSSSTLWTVMHADLTGFGNVMRENGFQHALDRYSEKLIRAVQRLAPDAILVSSKGLGLLTYLIDRGVWMGPSIMLSPIPNWSNHLRAQLLDGSDGNGCIHVDDEALFEVEWLASMKILKRVHTDTALGHPLIVGIGTSDDEHFLIVDMMEESQVCGNAVRIEHGEDAEESEIDNGAIHIRTTFVDCPTWSVYSFPGDHGWKTNASNAANIAFLVDQAFLDV